MHKPLNERAESRAVDHWTAIAAASLMVGINQLIINVQPLLLGALAENQGLTDTQLGLVSSALIGGSTCASLTAPLWVRRFDWRSVTTLFSLGAAAALFAASNVQTFTSLCLLFFGIGLLKGALGAPSFVSLGDSSKPERNFGISVTVQAGLAALAGAPMAAYLIPAYGVDGVYFSLIGALAVGLLAVRFLPRHGRAQKVDEPRKRIIVNSALLPFALVMLAMFLFTIGVTAFWFFLERIGTSKNVPAVTIGLAVSGTALITIAGSFLVTLLARWLGGLSLTVIGSLLIVLGYAFVLLPNPGTFFSGSLIFAFGWGICQPGYWALARAADPTARLFVLSSAVAGLGSVATGFLAGPIIGAVDYNGLTILAGSAILCGMMLCILSSRLKGSAMT